MKQKGKMQGVVILLHGLNNPPAVMDEIANVLSENNLYVVRGALAGHRGSLEDSYKVKRVDWVLDADFLYKRASEIATENEVRLFFVGYSLGALVFNDYINQKAGHQLRKMVLLAPAIWTKWYTRLSGYISWLLGDDFVIMSRNHSDYRIHKGASLAMYDSLQHSRKALLATDMRGSNIPTLVFLHPDDEMIDAQNTLEGISVYKLTNWKVQTVNTENKDLKDTFNHLFVDQKTMGKAQWDDFTKEMVNFLNR